MVQQQSVFSSRQMRSAFTRQDIAFSRLAEDGSQPPLTLAAHIEDGINEATRSNELILRFDTILAMCVEITRH